MKHSRIGCIEFEHKATLPIVPIEITSTLKSTEKRTYIGLIDTGASNTILSKKITEQLKLKKTGKTITSTGSMEKEEMDLYEIKAKIWGTDKTEIEDGLQAGLAKVNFTNCDVLIGLDILQNANFVYNGIKKSFSLSF